MFPQEDLREWEAQEAAKRALQKEVALKLKADREQQLADRNMVSGCVAKHQPAGTMHPVA